MSIASEISRLQTAKAGLKTAIEGKGVTVPSATTLDGYAALVDEISTESGMLDDWVRPSNWPDLDSIDYTDFDGYYLTYDLSQPCETKAVRLCVITTDGGTYVVERGMLNAGSFVAEESYEVASGQVFWQDLDESDGTIQLWRVTAKTGYIKGGIFNKAKDVNCTAAGYQPCVEKYQKTQYLNQTFNSADIQISGYARLVNATFFLQHDRWIGNYPNQTTLANAWRRTNALRLVDFSNASFPKVTSFAQSFAPSQCKIKFDSRGADFSAVTNMQLAFNNNAMYWCDMSTFVNSGGSLNRLFEYSYSIIEIYPMANITFELGIAELTLISHDSLMRIINALSITETAKTLSIGTGNIVKLSSDEIAIATAKGWTIA